MDIAIVWCSLQLNLEAGWMHGLLQYDEIVRQMRLTGIIFINPPGTRVTLYFDCKTRTEGPEVILQHRIIEISFGCYGNRTNSSERLPIG